MSTRLSLSVPRGWSKLSLYIYGINKLKDMNLTIEEVKVMRMALLKAPLARLTLDLATRTDVWLAENGWVLERRELPKKKYQRKTHSEYVWEQINQ